MPDERAFSVYVSSLEGGRIDVFTLKPESGTVSRHQSVPLSGKGLPLAVSPDRRRLYASVIGEAGGAEEPRYDTFRILHPSGDLEHLNTVRAPARMAHISVDRSGRYLLGASFPSDKIAAHPIGDRGYVQETPSDLRPAPSRAHQITTDASNRFVFVPNFGAALVMQLKFDAKTGRFEDNAPAEFPQPEESRPRHIAHHPNGRFAYLVNEKEGMAVACALDPDAGTLRELQRETVMPDGFEDEPWAAQIHVTPDGRHLFLSERRSSTLCRFAIDVETGLLSDRRLRETDPVPRCFDIDPSGRWLVSAGQETSRLVIYSINSETGVLDESSRTETSEEPIWVEIVELS